VAADLGARRYLGLGHIYILAIGKAERMAQGARSQGRCSRRQVAARIKELGSEP